jgi:hypothetical protein
MKRTLIQAAIGLGLTLALITAIAPPASAGGVTQVAGVAVFDGNSDNPGNCNELPSILTLELIEGDLIGCWYTTSASATVTPSGIVNERGTETFIGEWNEQEVKFDTTYKFTGKFDADGNEIHGRCQHPIVAGDVAGRIDFKDDVTTGEFFYRGHLRPSS